MTNNDDDFNWDDHPRWSPISTLLVVASGIGSVVTVYFFVVGMAKLVGLG